MALRVKSDFVIISVYCCCCLNTFVHNSCWRRICYLFALTPWRSLSVSVSCSHTLAPLLSLLLSLEQMFIKSNNVNAASTRKWPVNCSRSLSTHAARPNDRTPTLPNPPRKRGVATKRSTKLKHTWPYLQRSPPPARPQLSPHACRIKQVQPKWPLRTPETETHTHTHARARSLCAACASYATLVSPCLLLLLLLPCSYTTAKLKCACSGNCVFGHTHTHINWVNCACVRPCQCPWRPVKLTKGQCVPLCLPATACCCCPLTFLAHKLRLMDANSISLFLLLLSIASPAKSHSTPVQLTRLDYPYSPLRHWLLWLQISVEFRFSFKQ